MNVYGQLVRAQLERVASPSTTVGSRILWDTDKSKPVFDTGSAIRSFLFDQGDVENYLDWTEQSGEISAPASGKRRLYFKDDGYLYSQDTDGSEIRIGAGQGEINYCENSDADTGTDGWAAYADAAATTPADGTGGSPTAAISRVEATSLRDDAHFRLTKDDDDRQGEGLSYDFTIDEADQGRMLRISFDYIASANYAADDVHVWIYDVTNTALIAVTPFKLEGTSNNDNHQFVGLFQAAIDSTSYRLILHISTTNENSYTFDFDNVRIGPQNKSFGPAVTDWVSWTPTSTWSENVTHEGKWRRVGDSMEGQVFISLSGAPDNTSLILNLPSGYSIDTAKLANSQGNVSPIGQALLRDHGVVTLQGVIKYTTTTTMVVVAMADDAGTGSAYVGDSTLNATTPFTWANNDRVSLWFRVPIAGWSSNVEMSDDAETRVVAARYTLASTQSFASGENTIAKFLTKVFDTHNAYSTGTGKFTCPVAGKYRVNGAIDYAANSTNNRWFDVFKNDSVYAHVFFEPAPEAAQACQRSGSTIIDCVAGDTISFGGSQNSGEAINIGGSGALYNFIDIERISGPSKIAASEFVGARYTNDNADALTNGAEEVICFETKDYDTHGAVTFTNFAAQDWIFTCPVAGYYEVSTHVRVQGFQVSGGDWVLMTLKKNGSRYSYLFWDEMDAADASHSYGCLGSDTVYCVAGDTLKITVTQENSHDDDGVTSGSTDYTYISIKKVS
jgi:hypothetical protein